MNLLEWLQQSIEGYLLVRNIFWGIGGFFFVLALFSFIGKKKIIFKFINFLILSAIGAVPVYLSSLIKTDDIARVYNENLETLETEKLTSPERMLEAVKIKKEKFNSSEAVSIVAVRHAVKGTRISFSERQIRYVARGMTVEKMNIPMIFPYSCDDSMKFGRKTAKKLFPKLGITKWEEIFGIPEK